MKLYKAKDSGATKGPSPTKSLGAGVVNPCSNLILRASSQPAGN